MALLREPEYCPKCGKQLVAKYLDQRDIPIMTQAIGDTFKGYKQCSCESYSKEPQPVPEDVKPVLKSMEQVLKESYEKHTRANPGEKWMAWEDCETDGSNSLCYEAMTNWANQCTIGLSARLDWQINQSFKQSEEISTLQKTIEEQKKEIEKLNEELRFLYQNGVINL